MMNLTVDQHAVLNLNIEILVLTCFLVAIITEDSSSSITCFINTFGGFSNSAFAFLFSVLMSFIFKYI